MNNPNNKSTNMPYQTTQTNNNPFGNIQPNLQKKTGRTKFRTESKKVYYKLNNNNRDKYLQMLEKVTKNLSDFNQNYIKYVNTFNTIIFGTGGNNNIINKNLSNINGSVKKLASPTLKNFKTNSIQNSIKSLNDIKNRWESLNKLKENINDSLNQNMSNNVSTIENLLNKNNWNRNNNNNNNKSAKDFALLQRILKVIKRIINLKEKMKDLLVSVNAAIETTSSSSNSSYKNLISASKEKYSIYNKTFKTNLQSKISTLMTNLNSFIQLNNSNANAMIKALKENPELSNKLKNLNKNINNEINYSNRFGKYTNNLKQLSQQLNTLKKNFIKVNNTLNVNTISKQPLTNMKTAIINSKSNKNRITNKLKTIAKVLGNASKANSKSLLNKINLLKDSLSQIQKSLINIQKNKNNLKTKYNFGNINLKNITNNNGKTLTTKIKNMMNTLNTSISTKNGELKTQITTIQTALNKLAGKNIRRNKIQVNGINMPKRANTTGKEVIVPQGTNNTYTRKNLYNNASALRGKLTPKTPEWSQMNGLIHTMNDNPQFATSNRKAAKIRNRYRIPNSRKKN